MARISMPDSGRLLESAAEIRDFLEPFGIWYEHWDVEGRVGQDAENQAILDAYQKEIDTLKSLGGYVTADVINVTPETQGLDVMLNKFNKEHTHAEDEVRFIVKGRGVFHIHGETPGSEPLVFAIQVESGDLINVPSGTKHWFDLCEEKVIRAIRLFVDPSGWVPEYMNEGWHSRYVPNCFGPKYIPTQGP